MIFNNEVSVGDIIAFISLIGSILMFVLTTLKRGETKGYAQNANAFNESAKKYYDLMIEQLKSGGFNENKKVKSEKAHCDANIVRIASDKWILKIFNKGSDNATDVRFRYLEDEAPPILGDSYIKLLEPQKNVDYHLIIHMGLKSSSWGYEITWINEDGTPDSKQGILTLPLS